MRELVFSYKQQNNRLDSKLLNYLAGYFEGEGSICIISQPRSSSRTRHSNVLCASVGNTEKEILQIYASLFGGHVSIVHSRPEKNQKIVYGWKVHSRIALAFIRTISPYLKTKRKQELAFLAIDFQEHKKCGSFTSINKSEYFDLESKLIDQIKALNKRGLC